MTVEIPLDSEKTIRNVVAELANKEARFDDPHGLTFKRFPYARLMTVEIEVEPTDTSVSDAGTLSRKFLDREWEAHPEPSLSKRGVEFVSPTTAGDTLDEEVRFAVAALRGAGYDATPWASVHVHVDVRDMAQRDVGKIVLFSGLNQDSLYQVCPRHRYNSPFCKPFPRAFLDALEDRLRDAERCDLISDVWERHLGATMGHETAAWHMPSRWYGVNYRPFRTQGSLEWRMFNEPLDADAILRWCEVVHQVVDRGASMGLDEIAEARDWPGFFGSLGLRPGTYAAKRERRRRHWLGGRAAPDYSGLPTVQVGGGGPPR